MSLGLRIKERREELGKSVKELADACGVTGSSVYQWESGDVTGIKPDNMVSVSDFLKTTIHWLVTGKGARERLLTRDDLSPEQDKLLRDFGELDARQQSAVRTLIEDLGNKDAGNPGIRIVK